VPSAAVCAGAIEVYLVMIAGAVFGEAYRTGANRLAAEPENS